MTYVGFRKKLTAAAGFIFSILTVKFSIANQTMWDAFSIIALELAVALTSVYNNIMDGSVQFVFH